jgi:gamma-glutamyltranspeptidase/glutathione hydrolase
MLLDEQGRLRLLVGSPGGTRIIGFVAQSIVGFADWHLDVQQAVAAPHFLAEEGPVELEDDTDLVAQRAALEAMGHTVALRNLNSGLHAIAIDYTPAGRVLRAGVDPRREGAARGD